MQDEQNNSSITDSGSSVIKFDLPNARRFSAVLGENTKMLRKEQGIRKKTFALMVGISRPFLDLIEAGDGNPRLDIVVRIADALNVSLLHLLGESSDSKAMSAAELPD